MSQFHGTPRSAVSLTEFRLSLGGAIIGVSLAGIFSALAGVDRFLPDLAGGSAGFALAFLYLWNSRRS